MTKTLKAIEDPVLEEKVRTILAEPVGTPIRLTREEAIAIVEAGRGGRPDLPSGTDYVRKVKKAWRWMMPRE
jgi:hypothetical protein